MPGKVARNGHTIDGPASAGRAEDTGVVQGVTQGVVGDFNPRVARCLQIDEVDGQGGKILDIVPLPRQCGGGFENRKVFWRHSLLPNKGGKAQI